MLQVGVCLYVEFLSLPAGVVKQKSLTRTEFDKVISTPLNHHNRYLTRNIFLFSSMIGLAYLDMWHRTRIKWSKTNQKAITLKT